MMERMIMSDFITRMAVMPIHALAVPYADPGFAKTKKRKSPENTMSGQSCLASNKNFVTEKTSI